MNIYDRANWPEPDSNPLVLLWQRGDEWYSNVEVSAALGHSESRSANVIYTMRGFFEQVGDGATAMITRGLIVPSGGPLGKGYGGGVQRMLSRKAFLILCLRSKTANAIAFCDFIVDSLIDGGSNGQA